MIALKKPFVSLYNWRELTMCCVL